MSRLSARRRRNIFVFLVLAALLICLEWFHTSQIRQLVYYSGWSLLALVVFLWLFNLRKCAPYFPLISAGTWLQLHIYVGLLTVLVFGIHVRWRVPNGVLESTMAVLYTLVTLSGVAGLVMSRLFARRMTSRGPEEIFERIPRVRNHLLVESERLVLQCLSGSESTAIPEFYIHRLREFFRRPRNMLSHLMLSSRPRRKLLMDIAAQRKYLNSKEERAIDGLIENVKLKDDLDFQYAHQAALKYWLFVHIPSTYALLAFAVAHVVLVHAFSGDLS